MDNDTIVTDFDYWVELEAITRQSEDGRIDQTEFIARKKELVKRYRREEIRLRGLEDKRLSILIMNALNNLAGQAQHDFLFSLVKEEVKIALLHQKDNRFNEQYIDKQKVEKALKEMEFWCKPGCFSIDSDLTRDALRKRLGLPELKESED